MPWKISSSITLLWDREMTIKKMRTMKMESKDMATKKTGTKEMGPNRRSGQIKRRGRLWASQNCEIFPSVQWTSQACTWVATGSISVPWMLSLGPLLPPNLIVCRSLPAWLYPSTQVGTSSAKTQQQWWQAFPTLSAHHLPAA